MSCTQFGTRVVTHEFDMGDWEADFDEQNRQRDIHLWIVPARIEGDWLLAVNCSSSNPSGTLAARL